MRERKREARINKRRMRAFHFRYCNVEGYARAPILSPNLSRIIVPPSSPLLFRAPFENLSPRKRRPLYSPRSVITEMQPLSSIFVPVAVDPLHGSFHLISSPPGLAVCLSETFFVSLDVSFLLPRLTRLLQDRGNIASPLLWKISFKRDYRVIWWTFPKGKRCKVLKE